MVKKFLTGVHEDRKEFPPVHNLVCGECGSPMEFEFVNEGNTDSNGAVMKCTGEKQHTGWVTFPISKANFLFRFIRGQTENRHNSLRNRILEALGLCTCTNSYHGHRSGVHAFLDKDGNCPVCNPWTNPNSPDYIPNNPDHYPMEEDY